MNSDISHASDCVFYDAELKSLKRDFYNIYKIFKEIDKRAERRETIQISKSLFDYVERKRTLNSVPSQFFNFSAEDIRICIYKYRKFYTILVIGFDWLTPDLSVLRTDYTGVGKMYGSFDSVSNAIPEYLRAIYYYLTRVIVIDELPLINIDF